MTEDEMTETAAEAVTLAHKWTTPDDRRLTYAVSGLAFAVLALHERLKDPAFYASERVET